MIEGARAVHHPVAAELAVNGFAVFVALLPQPLAQHELRRARGESGPAVDRGKLSAAWLMRCG